MVRFAFSEKVDTGALKLHHNVIQLFWNDSINYENSNFKNVMTFENFSIEGFVEISK